MTDLNVAPSVPSMPLPHSESPHGGGVGPEAEFVQMATQTLMAPCGPTAKEHIRQNGWAELTPSFYR